jgi:hypothetical protein
MARTVHDEHEHRHSAGCAHIKVQHAGHVDYLHDGHLHHVHEGHIDEHALDVSSSNPADCTATHACGGHDAAHQHLSGCGHEAVPHGDHADYLVNGHLHRAHGSHCDDHGTLSVI